MKQTHKRNLLLTLVILIPILAAFLVGLYGYRSDKFGQGEWQYEYDIDFLRKSTAVDEEYDSLDHFMKFLEYGVNNHYHVYDPIPVYNEEIKDSNDNKLLDLLIFRAIYDIDKKGNDRIQYIFVFRNIQYLQIRELFEVEANLKEEINEQNVPTITHKVIPLVDGEEDGAAKTIAQISDSFLNVIDSGSDVDYISGKIASPDEEKKEDDKLVKIFVGQMSFRNVEHTTEFKLVLGTEIPNILDDKGDAIKTEMAEIVLELENDPEKVDYSDYKESLIQGENDNGYFLWVFKNYLWWISLIGFGSVGLITFSFYFVYKAEEKRMLLEEQSKKKRKK